MNLNYYAGDWIVEPGGKKPGGLMEREESQGGYLRPPTQQQFIRVNPVLEYPGFVLCR
jgi:hypothetical protein